MLLRVFRRLIIVKTDDVLRLLNTNGGDYAAACSLDFSRPLEVYDTFALRDVEGHEMLMQKWPYFRAKQSRRAILANLPVPVTSCWNGMGKCKDHVLGFSMIVSDYWLNCSAVLSCDAC